MMGSKNPFDISTALATSCCRIHFKLNGPIWILSKKECDQSGLIFLKNVMISGRYRSSCTIVSRMNCSTRTTSSLHQELQQWPTEHLKHRLKYIYSSLKNILNTCQSYLLVWAVLNINLIKIERKQKIH